jgi:hypothetical protein
VQGDGAERRDPGLDAEPTLETPLRTRAMTHE